MNGVGYGIHITTIYRQTPAEPVSERTPTFRNIHISNITAHDVKKGTISVTGLPERPVTGLVLENITMDGATGARFIDVDGLKLVEVRIKPAAGKAMSFTGCENVVQKNDWSPPVNWRMYSSTNPSHEAPRPGCPRRSARLRSPRKLCSRPLHLVDHHQPLQQSVTRNDYRNIAPWVRICKDEVGGVGEDGPARQRWSGSRPLG